MNAIRIERGRSQLLLIDLQERLLPAIENAGAVAAMCARLLTAANRLGVPVTISEQYPKGLGGTVSTLQSNGATVLAKTEFSCLANAELRGHIWQHRAAGREHIVVAGIEAHVCVAQTVLDLVAEGADVFVAADAVGSRDPRSCERALDRLARAGAHVVDSEMVMFEWLERAGTPEFKELQAMIR